MYNNNNVSFYYLGYQNFFSSSKSAEVSVYVHKTEFLSSTFTIILKIMKPVWYCVNLYSNFCTKVFKHCVHLYALEYLSFNDKAVFVGHENFEAAHEMWELPKCLFYSLSTKMCYIPTDLFNLILISKNL